MSAESPTPNREIAYRLFAAEFDDSTLSHAESDEERAPNYVISPTGARLNRLFVVGTLTEITSVNDEMLRARVVDPTGAFVVYAGQYQPDELAALEQLEPPEFVAITGKARTFQPDDSDQVYTSIRPESIAAVDAETRDRWVVSAAEQTIDRIGTYARAAEVDAYDTTLRDALVEAGVDKPLAQGISLAQDHYGTTPTYLESLRERALETAEVIAGDRDAVEEFGVRSNETNPESRSFEEIAADCAVELDISAMQAAVPDTATEEIEEPLESETAVASTAASTSSGDVGSNELLGSADGSEPEETDVSAELSSSADDESVEETDTVRADDDSDGDVETDADTQPAAEVDSDSTGSAATEPDGDQDADVAGTDSDDVVATEQSETSFAAGDNPSLETDDEPTLESDDESDLEDDDEMASEETTAVNSGIETSEAIESDTGSEDEDLGNFDSEGFDDGMYEMDDEEREELEAEYGAEFSTGAEVDDPGSADIDVPDEEEPAESAAEEAAQSSTEETDTEQASESEDEPDEDVDVQAQVIKTMNQLDDGDGADRSTVVSEVVDETGAAPDEVEDAIQDALMGGQCYEPDDETLKAI
ncbi:RPA family protein [Halostagnicola bangensis]